MIPVLSAVQWGAAAAIVASAFGAGFAVNGWRLGEKSATREAAIQTDAKAGQVQARASEDTGRKELQEALDATADKLAAARRDAAAARNTAGLLRDAYIRFAAASQAASDSAADPAGQDAARPGLVRPELYASVAADVARHAAQLGSAGADLAEAHAAARIANEQCRAEHAIARDSIERVRAEVKP